MSEPFVGQIMAVPYVFGAPVDWALCQGQQLQIMQEQVLYSLIGTRFGGDGRTNFNLPDLRGRTVIGVGPAQTLPGAPSFSLAQAGGGSIAASQLPAHTHPASLSNTTAQGPVSVPVTGSYGPTNVSVSGPLQATTAQAMQDVPQPGWALGDVQPGATSRIYANPSGGTPVSLAAVDSTGTVSGSVSGTAQGNVQLAVSGAVTVGPNNAQSAPPALMAPFLALNMIIAMVGLYPQQQ